MTGFLVAAYPWLKALHLIAVISWFAGLLYLPRLFVYHCAAAPGSQEARTFAVMERRLLRLIMNPALIAVWLFGLTLLFVPGVVDWSLGWPWVKAVAVVLLTGYHHRLALWRKRFAAGANRHPAGFYRAMNEVPTVLMIVIVLMVVVKPF